MIFSIDLLRHLLSIAVISQHMSSLSRYSAETNAALLMANGWIDGAVAGFFLLSGFFFRPQKNISVYVKKQFTKIMLPFFIFSIVYATLLSLLGKSSLADGILKTITLHGASMQLYFLPYLFLINSLCAILYSTSFLKSKTTTTVIFILLISSCLAFPTNSSTGSDLRLLPYYFLSFSIGIILQHAYSEKIKHAAFALAAFTSALGLYDTRFFDLTGVIILFWVAISLKGLLPDKRLPGSGGVYLMHTPILNFTISTILLQLSITESKNIILSIILTYTFCVILTTIITKILPKYKWVLLE